MEDSIETLVLVHLELTQDPFNCRGLIGMITSADLNKDDVFIGFGNNKSSNKEGGLIR